MTKDQIPFYNNLEGRKKEKIINNNILLNNTNLNLINKNLVFDLSNNKNILNSYNTFQLPLNPNHKDANLIKKKKNNNIINRNTFKINIKYETI